ncbi:hypothetical protein BWD42_07740 [Sphingobacterium sp. CZ-UAM]|uniref:hypothetical protein n=1 Tax=Sphingobacterium sp. CZ-UAM TaxID=1933868 RepID=UPI0009876D80|nr:hypothetical protein [Sphingobacterium sp. CZ-UAM]OOG19782.1 hypothetical protein BWD42_07740 [Sphingobacterium sp. CZ-UAM]
MKRKKRNEVTVYRQYLPPLVEIEIIELEAGIATSSAIISNPGTDPATTQIKEEWKDTGNFDNTMNW